MPSRVKGRTDTINQPNETGSIDRYGLATCQREIVVLTSNLVTSMPAKGAIHPVFTSMAVEKTGWATLPGGLMSKISINYAGFIGSLPDPVYEVAGSTNSDPIATHKDFVTTIGGTILAPKNGAVFDKVTREFRCFSSTSPNRLAGVTKYLNIGATWTKIYYSLTPIASLDNLAKIEAPDGGPPSATGGRTWLRTGETDERRGFVHQGKIIWTISDRKGWNPLIYA